MSVSRSRRVLPTRNEGVALAIACPYCDHKLNLKSPKPGRFRPSCPACDKPFVLIVPDQPEAAIKVRALAGATSVVTKESEQATMGRPLAFDSTPPPLGSNPIVVAPSSASSSAPEAFANTHASPVRRPATGQPAAAPAAEPPEESREERVPLRLDVRGYAVERELGRGGMGTVYLARQLSLDRPVALKVMSKRWATDPVFVARFTREAYAAAQLSHPNIVQIHDIGETHGTRFFSMEYVRGRTLADLLKLRGKLDPETAVGYVLQAARGLKHAHDRGMIHRDVKPDNLLLDDQGLVKVARPRSGEDTGHAPRGRPHRRAFLGLR